MEVRGQLSMTVVMVALDRGFLDRPVHSFDLAVGPGMLDLGQPVLNCEFRGHRARRSDLIARGIPS